MVLGEVGSDFDCKLQLVRGELIYEWVDSKRSWVLAIDAIVHHKKFTIWWGNSDRLHGLKVPSVDALVEVAVVQNHGPKVTRLLLAHLQIVVQHQA